MLISIVELHTVALFYNFDGGLRDDNDGCALGQPDMVLSGQEVCLGFIAWALPLQLMRHPCGWRNEHCPCGLGVALTAGLTMMMTE